MAVATMFRGEPSQLFQWCNFHLNAGADRLYVVLDRPDRNLVSALPVDARIEWHPIDQATWESFYPAASQNVERKQIDAFRWMARRATRDGHGYLAFIDADELIALSEPFAEVARRFADASAITLPVREMWYAEGDTTSEPFAAKLALQGSWDPGASRSQAFGWRASFLRNGLMGYDDGKTMYRLPLTAGEINLHRPRTGSLAARAVDGRTSGAVLHYDSGSLATWNAKWAARLDGGTLATRLRTRRRALERLFAHVLRQPPEEQEEFFRRFFSLDREAQAVLEGEGQLERVDVGELLVGPLTPMPNGTAPAAPKLRRLPPLAERVDYQFALVCDQRFVRPTFATMASVLHRIGDKGSVRFVVLGDGLVAADVARLRSLEHTGFDVEVRVHHVTTDLDQDVGTEDAKRATFGRAYLIDYLPPQRTVYLDGDVLATRDFTELFELDLGEACLAGVPDSAALRLEADPTLVPIQQRNRLLGITDGDPLEYLNGGVLIFDLDNPDFRELALRARALVVMYGRALKQRDQDALNIAFSGRKHRLESTYNYMTQFYVSERCLEGSLMERKYASADASLIHFSGRIKPWETATDEFYNGLYRRLVAEAEERLGVSCEFYFSRPAPLPRRSWGSDRWMATLLASLERPAFFETADIRAMDISDSGAYLKVSSEMYDLVRATGLRLAALAGGTTVFEVSLDGLEAAQAHLAQRVTEGVRKLPFDLVQALAPRGGVARQVELVVTSPDSDPHVGFVRSLGVVDVMAAGTSATSELLPAAGAEGQVETLSDGWMLGWCRVESEHSREQISLYIGDELVSLKAPAIERKDLSADGRILGFKFNVANVLNLGYGSGDREISVRVSRTNIPLPGSPLSVADLKARLRYDAERDDWVKPSAYDAAVAGLHGKLGKGRRLLFRVRRRLSR
ncbi:MAG TPA: glycosyltransferase [Gaiellaceae bacterium]|nr:glycosyltransferase [Gaiellaceae bacterium]